MYYYHYTMYKILLHEKENLALTQILWSEYREEDTMQWPLMSTIPGALCFVHGRQDQGCMAVHLGG